MKNKITKSLLMAIPTILALLSLPAIPELIENIFKNINYIISKMDWIIWFIKTLSYAGLAYTVWIVIDLRQKYKNTNKNTLKILEILNNHADNIKNIDRSYLSVYKYYELNGDNIDILNTKIYTPVIHDIKYAKYNEVTTTETGSGIRIEENPEVIIDKIMKK